MQVARGEGKKREGKKEKKKGLGGRYPMPYLDANGFKNPYQKSRGRRGGRKRKGRGEEGTSSFLRGRSHLHASSARAFPFFWREIEGEGGGKKRKEKGGGRVRFGIIRDITYDLFFNANSSRIPEKVARWKRREGKGEGKGNRGSCYVSVWPSVLSDVFLGGRRGGKKGEEKRGCNTYSPISTLLHHSDTYCYANEMPRHEKNEEAREKKKEGKKGRKCVNIA